MRKAAKDEEMFKELFEHYYPNIYKMAMKYTQNDKELSNDLTQEIFIKIYSNLSTLKDKDKLSNWILAVTKNVAIDFVRNKLYNQKKYKEINFSVESYEEIAFSKLNDFDPHLIVESHENTRYIINCINQLGKEEKEILFLRYYYNYTFSEIAVTLNLNENTIRTKFYRTKKEIVSKIKKELGK